jgi:hypothetical protein
MDSNKVKQIFAFGVDSYFQEMLQKVDLINPRSQAREQIKQMYDAIRSSAAEAAPTEVRRHEIKPVDRLVVPGTDFYFRMCQLAPQGPKDLVAILAMDAGLLPSSCIPSLEAALGSAPEPYEVIRLLTIVLTKGNGVAMQRVMLVAAKSLDGSLVPIPHSFQWRVSGQIVGGVDITECSEEEADRLTFLLYLVMDEDAATIRSAPVPDDEGKPLH